MRDYIWTWLFDDGQLLEQRVPASSWDAANANAESAIVGVPNAQSITVELAS